MFVTPKIKNSPNYAILYFQFSANQHIKVTVILFEEVCTDQLRLVVQVGAELEIT